ncbi:glycosyltransferase family protein [Acinetobacter haemolyticus]|uniref:Glycosyl transferase family 1 n=1 Tax=Acinetobacter haemolyticus TaxID=29430 RepID=A0AAJ3D8V3_ACIHA|nr:glycosyltransferase family 4 protein [Acinetobacter haemolyticus]NAR72999.1 glycosyl transferase family 1 [Acinetobacter haemolyticus]
MKNFLMVLKTQNLKNDQRVLKEINSLVLLENSVDIFVATDVRNDRNSEFVNTRYINIIGGSSSEKIIYKILGVFQFYIKFLFYLIFYKKKYDGFWVADPILFGVVLIINSFGGKNKTIIWDHHELPPKWFLNNKFFMYFFKKSYISSNLVIHANLPRKNYLEEILNYKHKNAYIISNYPSCCGRPNEALLDSNIENWIKNHKFIYLQNSLQDNRYGANVIKVAIELGYYVFHAGKINDKYLVENKVDISKVCLAGYLSFDQINRVLNKCLLTVILYKKESVNQTYCDANRLYQAMSLGVPVIIGNNPTLVDATKDYRDKIILNDDGQDIIGLKKVLSDNNFTLDRIPLLRTWEEYNELFTSITRQV